MYSYGLDSLGSIAEKEKSFSFLPQHPDRLWVQPVYYSVGKAIDHGLED
jgi:hypothetical protein